MTSSGKLYKRPVAHLYAALLAVAVLLAVEDLSADVTVRVPDTSAVRGSPISIPISLLDVGTEQIVSVEIFLSYDPLQMAFSGGHTAGPLVHDWLFDSVVGSGGGLDTLKVAAATVLDTIETDGVVLVVDFTLLDLRYPQTTPLTLEHVLLNDGTPAAVADHGSIKLTGADGSVISDPDKLTANQSIQVTIADADEDRTDGPDNIIVQVTNGDQTESFTAVESGDHSGEFTGSIEAVFSQGSSPSNDGVVQVGQDDLISFCYDDALDGSGDATTRCATTLVDGGTLGVLEATIVVQPADTVRIRVIDPDLNTSADQDMVSVAVTNDSNQDQAVVLLQETGVDTDVFFGLLFTALGSGSSDPADQVVNVGRGDMLLVTYEDAATGLGYGLALHATCVVIDPWGDASGDGKLRGFDAFKILAHWLQNSPLTGLDSLSANVDIEAPFGPITSYDASLVLQRRVGLIDHFPVQEAGSADHPQPESGSASPKLPAIERLMALEARSDYLAIAADERSGIVAGDLVVEGFSGRVEMAEELTAFLVATRKSEDGTRIAFAGSGAVTGAGDMLRLFPAPADRTRLVWASFNDGRIVGRLDEVSTIALPSIFALHPNVPNPFNPETLIRYELPRQAKVHLEIFNAAGQRVRILVQKVQQAGVHQVRWDGRSELGTKVAGGLYLSRLTASEYRAVRKMVLLK